MSLLRVELTLDSLGLGPKISISSCTVHILLILFLVDCRQEVWRRRSTCTRSWWSENSALARPPSSRDTSTSSSPSTTELLYPYLLHTSQNSQSSVTNQLAGCHVTGPVSQNVLSLNLVGLFVSQSYHYNFLWNIFWKWFPICCPFIHFTEKINHLWKQIILRKVSSVVFTCLVISIFFFQEFLLRK